jgi:arylsulfatase A-like enzyme
MKLSMYEGGLRVPGIVRWPGHVPPGIECREPLAFFDLMPTLCALAGTTPPADVPADGVNVLPFLQNGQPIQRPSPLYWQYDRAQQGPFTLAVRDGPWKLLSNPDHSKLALYDLDADVSESHDLAAEQPEVVARLKAQLERLALPPAPEAPPAASSQRPNRDGSS